jgi:hypothetical protein
MTGHASISSRLGGVRPADSPHFPRRKPRYDMNIPPSTLIVCPVM